MQQIILKLQFLGDSKKVNLSINSSLMPSPKSLHPKSPKVKPLPLVLQTVIPLGGAARSSFSLVPLLRGKVTG